MLSVVSSIVNNTAQRLFLIPLSYILLITIVSTASADDVTDYWSSHDDNATTTIDHSDWDNFLETYVDVANDHKVAYGQVTDQDKLSLETYLQRLSQLDPRRYSREEQYAYWINLYNALTIKVVLDHYPVKSIRSIKLSGGLFTVGPWKAKLIKINNRDLSLDNIEHDILRPIWRDARVHYAVNCASIGCPNLSDQAYTAENTEALLEQSARNFINSDKGIRFSGKNVTASKIYSWFKEDFGNNEQNLVEHLKQYADNDRLALLSQDALQIKYRYNWDLNDISQ